MQGEYSQSEEEGSEVNEGKKESQQGSYAPSDARAAANLPYTISFKREGKEGEEKQFLSNAE